MDKMVDKRLGVYDKRQKGKLKYKGKDFSDELLAKQGSMMQSQRTEERVDIHKTYPASQQAKQLEGSYGGFNPKPAVQVIIVAMKPLSQKSYIDQALTNKKGIS